MTEELPPIRQIVLEDGTTIETHGSTGALDLRGENHLPELIERPEDREEEE